MENKELTITRVLDAPRDLVWQAWTEQKHIQQWFGPKGFTNPVCEWDAKEGNKIKIQMKAPDGTIYPMEGTFGEISRPDKLVFLAGALDDNGKRLFDQVTTILFEEVEDGNKTKLTVHNVFSNIVPEAAPHLAGANEGWNMSLDKLTNLLNSLKVK